MVTNGKVVNVRMALEACGNIHGFEASDGVPGYIQAGTTPHVMNYLDDLLVTGTPLPMGLHCQTPLMSGAKLPKELLVAATDVTLSMLPGGTPSSGEPTDLTAQQMQKVLLPCPVNP